MKTELDQKLKNIRLLVMDFDGVFTDGYVYVNENGEESVRCSRKDGLGINMLQRHEIEMCVISKETNKVVSVRCKKLGIDCFRGVEDGDGKLDIMKRIMEEKGMAVDEVAYVGDDLNDRAPLEYAGVSIVVADSHPSLREVSDYVTQSRGGAHAVREVCELILYAKGIRLDAY
jgi:YrbI family 3-deoxy-D-manno-octulosonate 8-phosphate phosphatase